MNGTRRVPWRMGRPLRRRKRTETEEDRAERERTRTEARRFERGRIVTGRKEARREAGAGRAHEKGLAQLAGKVRLTAAGLAAGRTPSIRGIGRALGAAEAPPSREEREQQRGRRMARARATNLRVKRRTQARIERKRRMGTHKPGITYQAEAGGEVFQFGPKAPSGYVGTGAERQAYGRAVRAGREAGREHEAGIATREAIQGQEAFQRALASGMESRAAVAVPPLGATPETPLTGHEAIMRQRAEQAGAQAGGAAERLAALYSPQWEARTQAAVQGALPQVMPGPARTAEVQQLAGQPPPPVTGVEGQPPQGVPGLLSWYGRVAAPETGGVQVPVQQPGQAPAGGMRPAASPEDLYYAQMIPPEVRALKEEQLARVQQGLPVAAPAAPQVPAVAGANVMPGPGAVAPNVLRPVGPPTTAVPPVAPGLLPGDPAVTGATVPQAGGIWGPQTVSPMDQSQITLNLSRAAAVDAARQDPTKQRAIEQVEKRLAEITQVEMYKTGDEAKAAIHSVLALAAVVSPAYLRSLQAHLEGLRFFRNAETDAHRAEWHDLIMSFTPVMAPVATPGPAGQPTLAPPTAGGAGAPQVGHGWVLPPTVGYPIK